MADPSPALNAFARRVIGRPWGPQWDCWALVREAYREVYGLALPPLPHEDPGDPSQTLPSTAGEITSGRWRQVERPQPGDVVALGRRSHPHHCGLWLSLDGGRCLHNCDPLGVTIATVPALRQLGWSTVRFYRHTSHP